ncbi:antitoxin family protein [Thermococcus henrietii]|uniref:antitoxin family protein n=1 Tax=Thermococcus henrietii TaxID=2016361 RepID=UPI000C07D9AC|nr:antitoxin family protein [Thermococcus henrietii]
MEVIEAVYDHGVLKPLKKVDLKEGEKVRIVLKRSLYEVISELEKEFEDVDEDLGEVLVRERK